MKSLLHQNVLPGLTLPVGCGPGRSEVPLTLRKDGRLYRFILRDKLIPEDPYLVLVKATAFAIQTGEPNNGTAPDRSIKDFLIRSSVVS
jgi:hypothetical protein